MFEWVLFRLQKVCFYVCLRALIEFEIGHHLNRITEKRVFVVALCTGFHHVVVAFDCRYFIG